LERLEGPKSIRCACI